MKTTLFNTIMFVSKNTIYFFLLQMVGLQLLVANDMKGQMLKDVKLSLHTNAATPVEVFEEIERKTDFTFGYNRSVAKLEKEISVNFDSESLQVILTHVAKEAGLLFKRINDNISVSIDPGKNSKQTSPSQAVEEYDRTLKGKVIDADTGEGLTGATVNIKEFPNIGTLTDINGNFVLAVPDASRTLVISYIGFQVTALEIGDRTDFEVVLQPDITALQEIVVVGYGSQEQQDVTGSMSTVKDEAFNNGVIVSPEQLFQGKLPGVRVVTSSGEPGAGIDIVIRGPGSVRGGNSPLFVVDGVPLSNDATSSSSQNVGFGTSGPQNPLNFLNPDDIESINVLKDASAAAIYGARGSNGVVIITTKSGKSQIGELTYNTHFGVSQISNTLDLLSGSEYAANNEDGVYDPDIDTDWQDEIFRTGWVQSHDIAFGKTVGNASYRASIGYFDQEGIIEGSRLERITARLNASNSYFDDERLKIKLNFTVSRINNDAVPTSDNSGADGELITNALRANPTFPVRENGQFFTFPSGTNPIAFLDIYTDESRTDRILGNIDLSFRIIDNLHYKFNVGIDQSTSERNTTVQRNNLFVSPEGFYGQQNNENGSVLTENLLSYDLEGDRVSATLLAGHAYQRFDVSGTSFSVMDLSTEEIDPVNNPNIGTNVNPPTGFAQVNEIQSFFGRANLSWDNKYLVTTSLRADGSTRFGDNNKYGLFPSFALAWRASEEDFLQSDFITNLKLRTSWGQTGNQEIPNKITQASFESSSRLGAWLGTGDDITNGVTLGRTANPDLKWEVVTQANVGIDFELNGGRIYGTLDWFRKVTEDAILLVPSQAPAPTAFTWSNIDGEIINTGLEFALGGVLVRKSDFSWKADFNGTVLSNEVRDLPVSQIITGSLSGPGLSGAAVNVITNDRSLGSFLLFDHQGFDQDGVNLISDTNEDTQITNDDRIITGDALPSFIYGFNSYLEYKQWDFSVNVVGESGADIYNNTANAFFNVPQFLNGNNVPSEVINSGEEQGNTPAVSTLYLENAGYLRLNNLTLGYSFKPSILGPVAGLRLYFTAQNLFVITDYSGFDPAVNTDKSIDGNTSYGIDYASYPWARTFLLGLNVRF